MLTKSLALSVAFRIASDDICLNLHLRVGFDLLVPKPDITSARMVPSSRPLDSPRECWHIARMDDFAAAFGPRIPGSVKKFRLGFKARERRFST